MAFFLNFWEVGSLLLWKFGLGCYTPFCSSLALRAAADGKHDFDSYNSRAFLFSHFLLFWSTERQIATPNSNGSYIWNNFQDQTSTAKVTPPPKYSYKMPHYELQHTSGNFFSSRWWKFWHVWCESNPGLWSDSQMCIPLDHICLNTIS